MEESTSFYYLVSLTSNWIYKVLVVRLMTILNHLFLDVVLSRFDVIDDGVIITEDVEAESTGSLIQIVVDTGEQRAGVACPTQKKNINNLHLICI